MTLKTLVDIRNLDRRRWRQPQNGLRACTKSVRNCNKLPSLGLCSNPQPAYLNPTKCFEPLSSVYTRPWKLWLGSEAAVAAVAAAPKWPFVHKNRARIGPFCACVGGTDGNFLGLQHFPNVNTLQLKCFDRMIIYQSCFTRLCTCKSI